MATRMYVKFDIILMEIVYSQSVVGILKDLFLEMAGVGGICICHVLWPSSMDGPAGPGPCSWPDQACPGGYGDVPF